MITLVKVNRKMNVSVAAMVRTTMTTEKRGAGDSIRKASNVKPWKKWQGRGDNC